MTDALPSSANFAPYIMEEYPSSVKGVRYEKLDS